MYSESPHHCPGAGTRDRINDMTQNMNDANSMTVIYFNKNGDTPFPVTVSDTDVDMAYTLLRNLDGENLYYLRTLWDHNTDHSISAYRSVNNQNARDMIMQDIITGAVRACAIGRILLNMTNDDMRKFLTES